MDEWVEIKGSSVEVAVAAGMAELGIDEKADADIEVLQEPEKGFLGIGRQDAIVRVKPKPRPKRKRSRSRGGQGRSESGPSGRGGARPKNSGKRGSEGGGSQGRSDRDRQAAGHGGDRRSRTGRHADDKSSAGRGGRDRHQGSKDGKASGKTPHRGAEVDRVDIKEQANVIEEFLSGLLNAFGLDGAIDVRVEDDVIYADINGEQTEALIGQKATILQAIHDLTRTVVQRKTMAGVRLRLDIGGYRERRREALTIYAGRLAQQVIDEDEEILLEPMNPADRKTVHDAVADIDGVRSFSEGKDPRRSVVLAPDS